MRSVENMGNRLVQQGMDGGRRRARHPYTLIEWGDLSPEPSLSLGEALGSVPSAAKKETDKKQREGKAGGRGEQGRRTG